MVLWKERKTEFEDKKAERGKSMSNMVDTLEDDDGKIAESRR